MQGLIIRELTDDRFFIKEGIIRFVEESAFWFLTLPVTSFLRPKEKKELDRAKHQGFWVMEFFSGVIFSIRGVS